MTELLAALDFAHEANIIHRDVKPANVMIDAGGHAKLTDFGVARFTEADGDQTEKTRVGTIIGTPSYMSPEQIQGQTLDRRTDIFSAGVILYQLITWKKPFEGTQWALQKKIIEDDPAWPSTLVEIPVDVDRIVARALAKQPERRYQTAKQFSDAIQRVAQGKPLEGHDDVFAKPQAAAAKAIADEAEKEFWDGVKDSDDPDDLALYVEQFPQGAFVPLAQKKMAQLRGKKG
jgi:serine/threonine-protein kinase